MPEPEADSGEFNHGEEVGGVRGDTTAMFDLVEEPLDAVAPVTSRERAFAKRHALARRHDQSGVA